MSKPDNRRLMPPMPRSSVPREPGINTGPCKVPPEAVYRASRVPEGARRCWRACRPVIGYVLCIALGAVMAIAAGLVMLYIVTSDRH